MDRGYLFGIAVLMGLIAGVLLILSPVTQAGIQVRAGVSLSARPDGRPGEVIILSDLGIHSPSAIAFSPTHPEVIYAGAQDGLARSTDGGQSWESLLGHQV